MAVDSLITCWHMSFSRVACIKIIRHLTRRQPRSSPVSVSEEYQQRKNKNVTALVSIRLVSIPSSDVWYCADWWYVTHQCVTLFTHTHTHHPTPRDVGLLPPPSVGLFMDFWLSPFLHLFVTSLCSCFITSHALPASSFFFFSFPNHSAPPLLFTAASKYNLVNNSRGPQQNTECQCLKPDALDARARVCTSLLGYEDYFETTCGDYYKKIIRLYKYFLLL